MARRRKKTPEILLKAVKEYLRGEGSYITIGRKYGLNESHVRECVLRYQEQGALAFSIQAQNATYNEDTKRKAVEEYLSGKGSLKVISAKFGLRTSTTLRRWLKAYNQHFTRDTFEKVLRLKTMYLQDTYRLWICFICLRSADCHLNEATS